MYLVYSVFQVIVLGKPPKRFQRGHVDGCTSKILLHVRIKSRFVYQSVYHVMIYFSLQLFYTFF